MKKLFTIAVLFIASSSALLAQQDAEYTMYRFNGLYANPAYAGSREVISAMAIYRHQWVGVAGAPRNASVSINSPLNNNHIALGAIYTYDQLGVTKTNSADIDFAYRIRMSKKKNIKLSFGINAGFKNYAANLSNLTVVDPGDNNLSGKRNLWMPNVGAGIYAYGDRFFIGISAPNILANALSHQGKVFLTATDSARQYQTLFATAGYVFALGKKVNFMPSVLMKLVPKHAPVQFDFNVAFIFVDRLWLGVGYRLNSSYNFMAAVNITKQLRVGYAYDLESTNLSHFTSGTHEVMLGYDFNYNKSRVVNPRYVKYF